MRCTASITSFCCARNAFPRSVVHLMFSDSSLTTSGSAASRLDAGIPVLLLHRVGQRFVFQILVLGQPLLQLNDFQRIGGSHQRLAEQRIRDRARSALPGSRVGRQEFSPQPARPDGAAALRSLCCHRVSGQQHPNTDDRCEFSNARNIRVTTKFDCSSSLSPPRRISHALWSPGVARARDKQLWALEAPGDC